MTLCLLLVTSIYVILCPFVVRVAAANLDSFDKLVRQLMSCRRVPGLVVTVVDAHTDADPKIIHRQYGLADVEARRPMTTNTRVCIASLTKAFTSTLLGIMLRNNSRQVNRKQKQFSAIDSSFLTVFTTTLL